MPKLKVYNGSSWENATGLKEYNGSSFVKPNLKEWNGTTWETINSFVKFIRLQNNEYIRIGNNQPGFNNNEHPTLQVVLFEGYVKVNNGSITHELSSNYTPNASFPSSWWRLQINSSEKVYYTSQFNAGTIQTAISTGSISTSVPTYVKVWYNAGSGNVNFNVGGVTNSESHTTQYEFSSNGNTYIGLDAFSGVGTSDYSLYEFVRVAGTYFSDNYTEAKYDITSANAGDTTLNDISGYGTYNGLIVGTSVEEE